VYSGEAIGKARKRQEKVAGAKPEAAPMEEADGIKHMQVDPVLFHNARIANEDVYGVRNIWDEPEFCDDMKRRHPELRVKTVSRRTTVGGRGLGPRGKGRLIRPHGRVTFHKSYG
jgi:hypothetical protein